MPVEIQKESREGSLTSTKLSQFLQDGGNINDPDPATGFTPLAAAAKAGHPFVVDLLLKNKADVNKKSRYGCTPLYFAANARANRVEVVRTLLDKGADVDATDPLCDNETPLMVAITQSRDAKVVAMLYNAGASLQATNVKGETARSMAEKSGDPSIQRIVLPPDQQRPGLAELINALVNLIVFILAYVNSGVINGVAKGVVSNLYHIVGNTEPDQELAKVRTT
jgi:ankyrin repeat protein